MLSVSDAAAKCGLFHEYQALIEDGALFERALQNAAWNGEGACAEGVSLQGLLVLIDVTLEMLAEAGLQQLHSVYKAVKRHSSVHFELCMLWQTCHLSGASVRGCLKLGDGTIPPRPIPSSARSHVGIRKNLRRCQPDAPRSRRVPL
jgi:hypothetical protein